MVSLVNWDMAFSSLRCPDYKTMVRFHITRGVDLEMFTLGVRHPPQAWVRNPRWDGERYGRLFIAF